MTLKAVVAKAREILLPGVNGVKSDIPVRVGNPVKDFIEALGRVVPYQEMLVPMSYLAVDPNLQREINYSRVKTIIANFIASCVNPLRVVKKGNRFYIWDGQHTYMSLVGLGYTGMVKCYVYDANALSDPECRSLWGALQCNIKAPSLKAEASIAMKASPALAKDRVFQGIESMCERAGFTVDSNRLKVAEDGTATADEYHYIKYQYLTCLANLKYVYLRNPLYIPPILRMIKGAFDSPDEFPELLPQALYAIMDAYGKKFDEGVGIDCLKSLHMEMRKKGSGRGKGGGVKSVWTNWLEGSDYGSTRHAKAAFRLIAPYNAKAEKKKKTTLDAGVLLNWDMEKNHHSKGIRKTKPEPVEPKQQLLFKTPPRLQEEPGALLRSIRTGKGMTQLDLGKKLGLTYQAVSLIEKGTNPLRLKHVSVLNDDPDFTMDEIKQLLAASR